MGGRRSRAPEPTMPPGRITSGGATMPGMTRGAFRITEVPGERWELALEFLRDAGPMFVLDGPVPVSLQRYSGWPGADGKIHMCVYTTRSPTSVTPEVATTDFQHALVTLRQAIAADDRLRPLAYEVV